MKHEGELRLIDFDMTAVGPAGSELGFLALMLFRCGPPRLAGSSCSPPATVQTAGR
eukprot:SAG11_NODE_1208_length_5521_cov_4.088528_3_plen_56_part_00